MWNSAHQYSFWNAMTFWAAKFQVEVLRSCRGGGEGYLEVQLTLSKEKVNMLIAP